METIKVRMVLVIEGTTYVATPIDADECDESAIRGFRLKIYNAPEYDPHDVMLTIHGAACTCADWEFRRNDIDPEGCKHVVALKALGLISDRDRLAYQALARDRRHAESESLGRTTKPRQPRRVL